MRRVFLALAMVVGAALAADVPTISQSRLDGMVRYWQHVLRLDDWACQARFARLGEMPPRVLGYSQHDAGLRALSIVVLRPADYPLLARREGTAPKRGREIARDIEDTVLHELLHLRVRELADSAEADRSRAEEVVVDRLTRGLLTARFGEEK
jgi:signal transduction histidine kinase